MRLTDYVRRDLNLDPKRFPPRQLHAPVQPHSPQGQLRRRGVVAVQSVPGFVIQIFLYWHRSFGF